MGGMGNAPAINPNMAGHMMRNGMGVGGMGNMMGGVGMGMGGGMGMGMGNQGMMGMGNMGMGNMGMGMLSKFRYISTDIQVGYGNQMMSRVCQPLELR
jgi:hypothetical protein